MRGILSIMVGYKKVTMPQKSAYLSYLEMWGIVKPNKARTMEGIKVL
jgi:hypothetical protein